MKKLILLFLVSVAPLTGSAYVEDSLDGNCLQASAGDAEYRICLKATSSGTIGVMLRNWGVPEILWCGFTDDSIASVSGRKRNFPLSFGQNQAWSKLGREFLGDGQQVQSFKILMTYGEANILELAMQNSAGKTIRYKDDFATMTFTDTSRIFNSELCQQAGAAQ